MSLDNRVRILFASLTRWLLATETPVMQNAAEMIWVACDTEIIAEQYGRSARRPKGAREACRHRSAEPDFLLRLLQAALRHIRRLRLQDPLAARRVLPIRNGRATDAERLGRPTHAILCESNPTS